MKIGILTYHHVINDGAVLQTLGHLNSLRELFPDAQVEVIDYRYKTIEIRELIDVLQAFVRFKKTAFTKLRKYLEFKAFAKNSLTLSPDSITTDDTKKACAFIQQQGYDVVIVGSDEVWKILDKKYARKFPNIYWLPPQLTAVRIGSAVSANGTDESLLNKPDVGEHIRTCVAGFTRIATRDQFTYDLISRFINDPTKLIQVPDPTFGVTFEADIAGKLANLGVDAHRKTIALSFSSGPKPFARLAATIRAYADKHNIQLVAIGQQNTYAHLDLTGQLNPIEWAVSYRHFDFCITDRFHSTIFSMKNLTPFLVVELPSKYKGSHKGKIVDLLRKSNLLHHHRFVQEEMDIVADIEQLQSGFDKTQVQATVNHFRTIFRDHLLECVKPNPIVK
jgi:polysaccharide pyruvyl transferase WcaK-like protein